MAAAHLEGCQACQNKLEEVAGGPPQLGVREESEVFLAPALLAEVMDRLCAAPSAPTELGPPRTDLERQILATSTRPEAIGRFGAYDVLERIASGGMGIVFKAHDPALDRIVAVKVLSPALAASEAARSRFVREARAAAAVVHDNVVAIHAVGEERGLPYIVMQFVEGRSLQSRLETGPLELKEILRIGQQTAAGLAAAHAQGLIHRDVKPGNVLLENSVERVRLTDFGLARAVDEPSLTRPGIIAGTPEYMAPEQTRGEAIDARVDLFSLGAVLYAMSTGSSPFAADSLVAALQKVSDLAPQPPHELNVTVPTWLSAIILKLLAKEPKDRFQTAGEVARLLSDCLAALQSSRPISDILAVGLTDRGTKRRSFAPPRWVLGWVAAGLAIGAGLWWRLQPAARPQTAPANVSFVVRPEGSRKDLSFGSLEAAMAAAAPGGTIEICGTGTVLCGPVSTRGKPLRLRAAADATPVLVSTNETVPFITADAPLVLEGLEIRAAKSDSDMGYGPFSGKAVRFNPGAVFANAQNGAARLRNPLILANGVPLYVSHCRLVSAAAASNGQECALFEDAPAGVIYASDLYHATGSAVVWTRNSFALNPAQPGRLRVDNCILMAREALFFQLGNRGATRVECRRNTFVGGQAFGVAGPGAAKTVAEQNVFNVVCVARRRPVDGLSAPPRLWEGKTNLYSLIRLPRGPGNRGRPLETEFAKTVASLDCGSVIGEAGLMKQLAARSDQNQRLIPSDFLLNFDQIQATLALPGDVLRGLGAETARVGTGISYHAWRRSAAYEGWLNETTAAMQGLLRDAASGLEH